MENNFTFRFAQREDAKLILHYIKELASYENLLDQVVATEELLEEWIFDNQKAEAVFLMKDGKEVAYALIYSSFSAFLGRSGVFLDDLYVPVEHRGKGYGKAMLKQVAKIAVDRGCRRLEWHCLDWNQPSIDFYRSMGAISMDGWMVFRVAGESLDKLAEQN